MQKYDRILPNGYKAEFLQNVTEQLISEIWEDCCYSTQYKIQKGDIVLDIGANQGVFSLYAASQGAVIYAFEPDNTNYDFLLSNIRKNNLEKQIIPFMGAVASEDGFIPFFVPVHGEGVDSSTFATTSTAWIDSLTSLSDMDVSECNVKAYSLTKVLNEIIQSEVSLLKIDTEGAEMDILSRIDSSGMKSIKRIIMETHDAYSERDLYKKVLDLDFNIITYRKLQGPFRTGSLYAENISISRSKGWMKPVAIFDVPDKIVVDESIMLDASGSFDPCEIKSNKLLYQWTLDSVVSEVSESPVKNVIFNKNGCHFIVLTVRGNDSTFGNDDNLDQLEKMVWVFSKGYEVGGKAVPLATARNNYCFEISDCADLFIPSESFPKSWIFKSLFFCLEVLDVTAETDFLGIFFKSNGEVIPINQIYKDIYFTGFPNNHDFAFSLESRKKIRIQIIWYVSDNTGFNTEIFLDDDSGNPYLLENNNTDYVCVIHRNIDFIVHKESFPRTWKMKIFKFCLSVHSDDSTGDPMEGSIRFNGLEYNLKDWFQEFKVPYDEILDDFTCHLTITNKRIYKFTWWSE